MPRVRKPSNLRPALLRELRAAPSNSASPFALLTPLIPLLPPPVAALPTISPTFHADLIEDTPVLLELDYANQFNAGLNFPPLLDTKTDCAAISRYQTHMETVIDKLKAVCCCCGSFTSVEESSTLNVDGKLMLQCLTSSLIVLSDLDSCGIVDRKFRFCKQCITSLRNGRCPKYGSTNKLSRAGCQLYPPAFDGLSMAEEAAIARAHPVTSILKLRPNRGFNPTAYHAIKGHVVLLPQNPSPLLSLLPSPEIALHDLIRVVWCGKGRPTDYDLRHFVQVRRQKILDALTWLQEHNPLYRDIVINHDMLETMPDEFIPEGISSRVVSMNQDSKEREGYAADFNTSNDENDLHHVLGTAGMENTGLSSGCIYTDVNEARQNPYLKLISAINNLQTTPSTVENSDFVDNDASQPMLIFNLKGNRIALNDWDNADFFLLAFPTLFPHGDGGHCTPRPQTVSLQAWAKWALSHHSRRFARHPVFMYVVYDVIQRRATALGYSLLVKSQNWSQTQELIAGITHNQLCEVAELVRTTNTCKDPAVLALENLVQLVSAHVPHSFAKCYEYRLQMRALMITNGMPVLWITFNPSDLRCPIVLWLAGIRLPVSDNTASAFKTATATINPIAIATFFNQTCTAIFDHLLAAGSIEGELFGPVSTYFGIVETNGRGMLHLHCLVWLTRMTNLSNFRQRICGNPSYLGRLLHFLDHIITTSLSVHSSNLSLAQDPGQDEFTPLPTTEHIDAFRATLVADSNKVASKVQMHSPSHNASCYKYSKSGSRCRFNFPRPLVEEIHVDKYNNIHFK